MVPRTWKRRAAYSRMEQVVERVAPVRVFATKIDLLTSRSNCSRRFSSGVEGLDFSLFALNADSRYTKRA